MGDPQRAASAAERTAGAAAVTVSVVTSIAGPAVRVPAAASSGTSSVTTSAGPHVTRPARASAPSAVSAVSPVTSSAPAVKSPVTSTGPAATPVTAAGAPLGRAAGATPCGAPARPAVSAPSSASAGTATCVPSSGAARGQGVTSPSEPPRSVTITVPTEERPAPAPRPKPPRRLVKQMSMAAMLTGPRGAGGSASTPAEQRGVLRRSSFSEDYFPSAPVADVPPVSLCTPLGPGVVLKKTLDGGQGQRTRRCSLTQPWATLYGSWQLPQPVSAASSRNGSTEGIRRKSSTGRGSRDTPDTTSAGEAATGLLSRHKPVLFARHLQKVTRKDFGSEVRASLDVSHFIKEAQLLLDVGEMSVEGVVDQMLRAMLDGEPMTSLAEAKSVVFVHDSGE